MNDADTLERAVLAQGPPGALLVGASVSPDGRYGTALTLDASTRYPMDDILEWSGERWKPYSGGSGAGTSWTRLGKDGDIGVLRFAGVAPAGVSTVVVEFQGQQHRVTPRYGHFLFVAWYVGIDARPALVAME